MAYNATYYHRRVANGIESDAGVAGQLYIVCQGKNIGERCLRVFRL